MALSKKQVKQLRAMANQLNPLLYIGKNDLTDAAVKQASETMDSHELLKVAVQDGSGSDGEGGRRQARRPDRCAGGAGHRQPVRAVPQELTQRHRAHPPRTRVTAAEFLVREYGCGPDTGIVSGPQPYFQRVQVTSSMTVS